LNLKIFQNPSLHLLFFQTKTFSDKKIEEILKEGESDFSRIRCPICKWQPKATSRWFCADCGYPEYFSNGCGAYWNTFETQGKCPGCQHQWRWTSCLSCSEWSLHVDWYLKETEL
jgi:hypothetical protein